jgi:hypothetical protein
MRSRDKRAQRKIVANMIYMKEKNHSKTMTRTSNLQDRETNDEYIFNERQHLRCSFFFFFKYEIANEKWQIKYGL